MAHSKSQNACLVCGKELIYHEESVEWSAYTAIKNL